MQSLISWSNQLARFAALGISLVFLGCGTRVQNESLGQAMDPRKFGYLVFLEQQTTAPIFIRGNEVIYPLSRISKGESGRAVVEFTISPEGKTQQIRVVEATYPAFGSHTAYAVKTWRFKPAEREGVPVETRVRLTYDFRIR